MSLNAPGPDNITLEKMEILGEFRIKIIAKCPQANGSYNKGYIPNNLTKPVFIALPQKPAGAKSEDDRTVSLMIYISELLHGIIAQRGSTMRPDISNGVFGFVDGKSTI